MNKPWVEGPKELLIHGLEHLKKDTHFDCRMAMVCVDNSVELMIKTYLGLPKRITQIQDLSRNKYEEIIKNFPSLLDGLEKYAEEKLVGIELGDIEWYHRVRNELYHNGNGITVEKSKVEGYAETAKILFNNLFGFEIEIPKSKDYDSLIGQFIRKWADFESLLRGKYVKSNDSDATIGRFEPTSRTMQRLLNENKIRQNEYDELIAISQFRNNIVHGHSSSDNIELTQYFAQLEKYISILKSNQ